MAFNGKEGKQIPLGIAKKWTKNYRDKNPGDVKAHFYGKEHLLKILNEDPDCKGIRIYYGLDDSGNKKLVLLGASENQNNIYPQGQVEGKDATESTVLDDGAPCPDSCPDDPNDPLT